MKKKIKTCIIVLLLVVICISVILFRLYSKTDLFSVKSQGKLKKLYNRGNSDIIETIITFATMPWSIFGNYGIDYAKGNIAEAVTDSSSFVSTGISTSIASSSSTTSTGSTTSSSSSKDYSTTNIQVENVDEADITKTDGDFIYSLSDDKVVITDVQDPNNIKIASKIPVSMGVPEDLILYNNKLVIISAEISSSTWSTSKHNTIVDIYNIDNKEAPIKVKNYKLYEPYYTSRCIGNRLYVISSGNLRKESDKIVAYYTEDNKQIDLDLDNMFYLKNVDTDVQTLISTVDLDNPTENISIQSYLIDISNAYVSENNIYLLNQEYGYNGNDVIPISSLFSLKGALGLWDYENDSSYSNRTTYIYKFNINNDGSVKYDTKTKVSGQTINQFSIDEYDGNLRVALYDNNGSKVVVFNKNLEKIGETSYLAKGERMYSSRFIGNKAYLVTYKTIDPLYVIDLSNPSDPTVLGELKIPGYSTYLHPYDENHLIGIGMETEEKINRTSSGKVISKSAVITGMKMALFDVSDVNNPKQISSTVIGNRRTTSAILTNHKALLFSKEKELLAIPVNNYDEDFEITNSSESYSSVVNSYTNYNKSYISEGYLVYKINLEDGFKLKGSITHDYTKSNYSYSTKTNLLRGLYIEDNLYTISESTIKVNKLDNLELIGGLNLRTETQIISDEQKKD